MKNFSILIAEDESIVLLDLKNLLKQAGFEETISVQDGDSLIKQALDTSPSLIISDVYLKGKTDGLSAAEKIWKKQKIPFIFISGSDLDRKKLDLSRCEIVKKPFSEGDIIRALKKFYN